MPPNIHEMPLLERRLLRWSLLFYCLFILYGTFIPFRFSSEPSFVQSQWQHFFTLPFVNGGRRFSLLDVASNLLLFIPFGFLWLGSELTKRLCDGALRALLCLALLGGLFSLAIECGQLFAPGRTAALLDTVSNATGAAIGGLAGYLTFSGLRGALGAALIELLRRRPTRILLALLIVILFADAYYPFQITLDVSTAWHNLKHTQWRPFAGGALHRHWIDLLVEKVLPYAAIGYLTRANLAVMTANFGAGSTLILCGALAFAIEVGKLLFVGRIPNAENFFVAIIGATLGVTLLPRCAATRFCRRHAQRLIVSLLIALWVYVELSPFEWIQSRAELAQRLGKIEWLPLAAYYGADPQSALFDLGKKLVLVGPLGFLIASRRRSHRRLAAIGFALTMGVLLEALQVFLRLRIPSVTDVLLFTAAGAGGAILFEHYSQLTKSPSATSKHQQLDSTAGS